MQQHRKMVRKNVPFNDMKGWVHGLEAYFTSPGMSGAPKYGAKALLGPWPISTFLPGIPLRRSCGTVLSPSSRRRFFVLKI